MENSSIGICAREEVGTDVAMSQTISIDEVEEQLAGERTDVREEFHHQLAKKRGAHHSQLKVDPGIPSVYHHIYYPSTW